MVNFRETLPDILGIATSLSFVSVLLMAWMKHHSSGWRYPLLILMLALGGMIDSAITFTALQFEINGKDPAFLDFFFQPVCTCMKAALTILAVLRMIHANVTSLRTTLLAMITFIVIVLTYPFVYATTIGHDEDFWCIANYVLFANSPVAVFFAFAINITVITFAVLATKSIIKGYRSYRDTMNMYFSVDLTPIFRRCIIFLAFCLLFTTVSIADIAIHEPWMKPLHRYTAIVCYAAMTLIVLYNTDLLERIEKANRYIRRIYIDINTDYEDGVLRPIPQDALTEDVRCVKAVMEQWINRPEKPYNQRCITLQSAADEMGLPKDVVQKYVKIIYDQSFRDWILSMRE